MRRVTLHHQSFTLHAERVTPKTILKTNRQSSMVNNPFYLSQFKMTGFSNQ